MLDLPQGKAITLQALDIIHRVNLLHPVMAVACEAVHLCRREQTDSVVMMERLNADLAYF